MVIFEHLTTAHLSCALPTLLLFPRSLLSRGLPEAFHFGSTATQGFHQSSLFFFFHPALCFPPLPLSTLHHATVPSPGGDGCGCSGCTLAAC